jgi:hypothetical protein
MLQVAREQQQQNLASSKKKQICPDTYPHNMCTTNTGQAARQQIKLPGRASDTVPSGNKTSMSDDNNKKSFGRNSLIKGCLLFNALAWPQQLQVKSKSATTILDGSSQ